MKMTPIGAKSAPQASGGYSQAIEVVGIKRQLFISGQIPVDADDNVPNNFDDQARLVWKISRLNSNQPVWVCRIS